MLFLAFPLAIGNLDGQVYEAISTTSRNKMVPWRAKSRVQTSVSEHYNQSPQALYHDLPLDSTKQEIRVLDILPGRFGDPLRAELRVVSRAEEPTPAYEALSYTCGPATRGTFAILQKNVKFPITDNLYDALQRLRQKRKTRTLWVDAICINQQDNERRAIKSAQWAKSTEEQRMSPSGLGKHEKRHHTKHSACVLSDLHQAAQNPSRKVGKSLMRVDRGLLTFHGVRRRSDAGLSAVD